MRTIHAIRSWDASTGEDTLCGISHTERRHVDRSQFHEYVNCSECRAHGDFDADPNEAPWSLPGTATESTAQLRLRTERQAAR